MTSVAGAPAPGAPPKPEVEYGPDGEIIGAPRTMQQIAAARRLQQQQAQVDEVVDIMKTNVDKVLERDAKLSELDDRADALQQGASQFEQQAKSLKNKFWLENLKMMIIMGVIGIVIIGLLFVRYRGTPSVASMAPSVPNATANNTVQAITQHCVPTFMVMRRLSDLNDKKSSRDHEGWNTFEVSRKIHVILTQDHQVFVKDKTIYC